MELNNLNDRYTLLGYDINLMKNTIKTIDVDDLLTTCPQFAMPSNTLFYHFSDSKGNINKKSTATQYELNFLGHINKNKDFSHCQVLWNNKELKLLDLTLVSIELGFNPTMFYIHDRLKNSNFIDYCQNHDLDGVLTYDVKNLVIEEYDEESATYIKNNNLSSLSPILYLVKNNLKILSDIELTKSGILMKKSELIKLHNVVFCSLLNMMSIALDNDLDLALNTNLLLDTNLTVGKSLTLYGEREYTLNEFFNLVEPHLLSLLSIDSSNLYDDCQFDYYKNINLTQPTIIENLKADIIINSDIQSRYSDGLFDLALKSIAEKFTISPFIYVNYVKLNTMMIFYKYNLDLIRGKPLNEMKMIFNEIEKIIVNQLFLNYKNTSKGNRGNINFINLEYAKTTYQFIKSHIMDILNTFDDFISFMGGQVNKNIVNYFNVNYLYHQIVGQKYEKPKLLHQDLLNDVTKYKHLPSINLRYLKIISKLSSDIQLTEFLDNTELEIYNFYKSYVGGEKLFIDLYQFLGVDAILEYLKIFAVNNNLNPSIVIGYHDLSLMDQMENYSVYELYDQMKGNDIDFYKSKLHEMKSKILVVKFLNILLKELNLTIDNADLRTFLLYNVEKMINEDVEIKNVLTNNEVNWYDIAKEYNEQVNQQLFQLFSQNNTNEELLPYIYNYLDQDLLPKTKLEILQLIKQKNLLQIWLSYLNGEISKDTLSKIVFVDFSELSKQQSSKREKERSKREEEDEERTRKSKSKKTKRDEEQVEEITQKSKSKKRDENQEREEIEREERKRRKEQKSIERKEKEQKEIEREERRERRKIEKEEAERLEEATQKDIEREEKRERQRLKKEETERLEAESEDRRQARKIEKELEKERAKKIAIENDENESETDEEDEETQSM